MATVTGFTAERMLQIEKTTVVDGDVVGDNLILLTREGTQINAGNVRGPQGAVGPAGPVSSVNDQTGASYAPRIFASRGAIDTGWAAAPTGAFAVTTDTNTVWEKTTSGWVIVNAARIFASATERDSLWPNPPEGALAIAIDGDVEYYKAPAGWNISNGMRVFADATERDARWPSPPNGAMCYLISTNVMYVRKAGFWQPPVGTMVYSFFGSNIPDLNTGNIWPGWASDVWISNTTTFAYPVKSKVSIQFNGGYGADWIAWHTALHALLPGNPVQGALSYGNSNAAYWDNHSHEAMWDVPAGSNAGFKIALMADAMGGNSTNIHTGGCVSHQCFAN